MPEAPIEPLSITDPFAGSINPNPWQRGHAGQASEM
jgi:hypothetical protein